MCAHVSERVFDLKEASEESVICVIRGQNVLALHRWLNMHACLHTQSWRTGPDPWLVSRVGPAPPGPLLRLIIHRAIRECVKWEMFCLCDAEGQGGSRQAEEPVWCLSPVACPPLRPAPHPPLHALVSPWHLETGSVTVTLSPHRCEKRSTYNAHWQSFVSLIKGHMLHFRALGARGLVDDWCWLPHFGADLWLARANLLAFNVFLTKLLNDPAINGAQDMHVLFMFLQLKKEERY